MNDILLIIIPLLLLLVSVIYKNKKTNKIMKSNRIEDRITRISMRPRAIKDNNHKLSHVDKLMIPEEEPNFDEDIINFVRKRLSNFRG